MSNGIQEKIHIGGCILFYIVGLVIVIWTVTQRPFAIEWWGMVLLIFSCTLLADYQISKLKRKVTELEQKSTGK